MNDPVDELTEIALAQYAVAAASIREAATALGMPEDALAAVLARAREHFLGELAERITDVRQACDDAGAVRH